MKINTANWTTFDVLPWLDGDKSYGYSETLALTDGSSFCLGNLEIETGKPNRFDVYVMDYDADIKETDERLIHQPTFEPTHWLTEDDFIKQLNK